MVFVVATLVISGCDDATSKLKQRGAEVAEVTKAKIQEAEWGPLLAEFESAGLNIRELATLFANNRWDEAKTWIAKVDSQPTRAVFQTVGAVLYLEEVEGVEQCLEKVDELLKNEGISPEQKKTLEIMRRYVGGKSGRKTSDIAIIIGLAYLSHNGFDYEIKLPHGNKMELDKMLFLAAMAHAKRTLHEKTNSPTPTSAADTKPLRKQFRVPNFGAKFDHSTDITIEHNPHGGANHVAMSWNGKPIGGLKILVAHPIVDQNAEFVEAIKEKFKETLNASSVEYRTFENPHTHKFHEFKAHLTKDGTEYIAERYVHQRQGTRKGEAEAYLDRMFGAFMFDFLAPATDYAALKQETDIIINSFQLKDER